MLEHRFSFKPDPAEQQSHFSSPATSYHSAQPHQSHQQSTFTAATGMFESLLKILKKRSLSCNFFRSHAVRNII